MILLGLDFETSGRDPSIHSIVEVGAVLWCTELRKPIRSIGYLVHRPGAVWEEGATEVNGITQEQCSLYGVEDVLALLTLTSYYRMADVIVAHNGNNFDRLFYEAWCERLDMYEFRDQGKTWIDTRVDLDFPKDWSLKLKYLAAEHGILHRHAHGALPDVNIMLEILNQYDLNRMMESAASPTVLVQAVVPFESKDKAKVRGYYWRPTEKQWVKSIKAARVQDEVAEAGFPIRILKK
jgi:DNA polymerase III alpha subunit (gram-positive type)